MVFEYQCSRMPSKIRRTSRTGSDFVYFQTMLVSLINPPSTLTKFAPSSVRPFRCKTRGSLENVKNVFPAADGPRTKTQIRDRSETVLLESEPLRCLLSRSFIVGSIICCTSTSTSVVVVVFFESNAFFSSARIHLKHFQVFFLICRVCE